ncbi:MAG: TetR/AcrR family transcriptional regulator, partial [Caldilineaceae bacterium]|nr:TetR/AcrR family transcriptional regulator [Caldilineaceae bacterium]
AIIIMKTHIPDQRTNILGGARRAIARKGMAATMTDIAEAAGVSQGLAYRYFGSKEEILRELISAAVAQAEKQTVVALPTAEETAGEQLRSLLTRLIDYRRDHLEIFQLLDQLQHSEEVPADFSALLQQRGEAFVAQLRALIVAGQASGEVAAGDPDQLVTAVVALLDGIVKVGMHDPSTFAQRCPTPVIILRMLGL